MARADPENDTIRRFVVRHYRYDSERHERRHVLVAAFDNEREYKACMEETAAAIKTRRSRGEPVEAVEHVTGQELEPGYRRKQRNARLVERATQRGARVELRDVDMPPNVDFLRAERRPWWRRLSLRRPDCA